MKKIGIAGYGNLGRGVRAALAACEDMELAVIFSRRSLNATDLGVDVPCVALGEAQQWRDRLDALIVCGGSAHDLPEQVPVLAQWFNTIDSFDTHAKIPQYFDSVDQVAKKAQTTSIISVGWDPGLFSLQRLLGEAILPQGASYTFWGKGLSQGHSDALRRLAGVKNAVQYTIPLENALAAVRRGEQPQLTPESSHRRECFVVLEDGADAKSVEAAIVTMPNYFAGYDTHVHFIDQATFDRDHRSMAHGGFVLRSGDTESAQHLMEFSLKLDSNPQFTASVLVAYARAACRMHERGWHGAFSVFDVPPADLSTHSAADLRAHYL